MKIRIPSAIGIAVIVIMLDSSAIFAQGPDVSWAKNYGGFDDELGYCIEQTSDGGYIVSGGTASYGQGHFEVLDAYIIKLNSDGDTIWTRTYGVDTEDDCFSIKQTADGGYIAAIWGFTDLMKLDSNGDSLWTKSFGDNSYQVAITGDGGYILVGDNAGISYLTRTDSLGDIIWRNRYSFPPAYGSPHFVSQVNDGGYVAVGTVNNPVTDICDCYMVRINAAGETLCTRTYNYSDSISEEGVGVCQTADNGFLILCQNWLVIRTDSLGNEEWAQYCDSTYGSHAFSISALDDGTYLLSGRGPDDSHAYLMSNVDDSGQIIWIGGYGEPLSWGRQASPTSDGGFVMIGYGCFGSDYSDIRVIKFSPVVGIGDREPMPREVGLSQNRPNPFNSSTMISYSTQAAGHVSLAIYDLLGRKIAVLSDAVQSAGEHKVVWDASVYRSGVYFAKLESGNYSRAIKIVLLK